MSIVKIAAKKEKDPLHNLKRGVLYGTAVGGVGFPTYKLLKHKFVDGLPFKAIARPISQISKSALLGAGGGLIVGGLGGLFTDINKDWLDEN